MPSARAALTIAAMLAIAMMALFPWLLSNIFQASYLPHGFCFMWNQRLLWLHIISDGIVWISYTAIATTLAVFLLGSRKPVSFQNIFVLFGTFIMACGFTHLLDIVVLWHPLYWLQGDMKLLNACASLITAAVLPFCIPQVKAVVAQAAESAQNARRFLAAAESSLDSLYLLGSVRNEADEIVDFRFLFVNCNAARLVASTPERLIGNLLCASMPQNRDRGFFEAYKRVAETGVPHIQEFAVNGFHGVTAEWLKIQVVKLEDGVAVTCSDISERKQLEAEREAAFAESMIDKIPAAVILTGSDHSIRVINPAACTMLLYRPEELVGRATPLIFFDAKEAEALAARLTRDSGTIVTPEEALFPTVEGGGATDRLDWTFHCKDGSTVMVEASVTPLRNHGGHNTGFMITAYDITERKRREESAANAKSQIDAIHRSLMAIEFDMDGRILDANENYLAAFGYKLAEVAGRHHSLFVDEEYRHSAEYQEFWAGLRKGKFRAGEFKRVAKDGSEVWMEASYNPVLGREGVPVKVVKFASNITDRVSLQKRIVDAENQLRAIVNNVVDGIITIDHAGTITSVNPGVRRMFEYDEFDMVGSNVKMLMPDSDSERHDDYLARYQSTVRSKAIGVGRELKGRAKSGRLFPVEVTITEVWMRGNRLFVGLVRDITERKRAEKAAASAAAFAESLIANCPSAIVVTGPDSIIRAMNPAAEKMLWYKPEDLVGRASPAIFYDREEVEAYAKRLSETHEEPFSPERAVLCGPEPEKEWTFRRKGGMAFTVQATVTPLKDAEGEGLGFMITAYDVSERKRREEYISHLANHDLLTGLPTRQLLMDRLEMMIARSDRFAKFSGLFMIDLNNFKQVNDTLGHHVGDRLLVQVAGRLRASVRAIDTVARMGGDEFVVLAADLDTPGSAERVAEKLLASFATPFELSERNQTSVSASIGVCVYPSGGGDSGALLKNADIAMYHAKATRQNRYQVFDKKIAEQVLYHQNMESALRGALAAEELQLLYQPQYSLGSGTIVGVEALLRWNSRQFGPISPERFIPVAEQSGLIIPIGAWAIETACAELARLQGQIGPQLLMAVNLSMHQLEQPDLFQVIENALTANRLDPASLEIEITESLLMNDSPKVTVFFEGLRKFGVRVAIDDFGTGFSSMASLLRFSVDRLKIDRCFIQDSCTNPNSATVTSAIIGLAHQLSIVVVAEGVETEEQMDFLRSAGCDYAQGFYLGRPMTAAMLAEKERKR
jgi:diguanylate cyclase (GGDEF)-like protein/PAS domain S-box-containing protein